MSVNTHESMESRFPLLSTQEALALDLQVMSADLSNLADGLGKIVRFLKESAWFHLELELQASKEAI